MHVIDNSSIYTAHAPSFYVLLYNITNTIAITLKLYSFNYVSLASSLIATAQQWLLSYCMVTLQNRKDLVI